METAQISTAQSDQIYNKIWYEMTHMKKGENYLGQYIGKARSTKMTIKVITIGLSASGAIGTFITKYIPYVAVWIVLIVQTLSSFENQIFRSDKDIDSMCTLRDKYISYFNKLEKLWTEYRMNGMTEAEAKDSFYNMKSLSEEIESLDSKLYMPVKRALSEKAENTAKAYFNQYHQ